MAVLTFNKPVNALRLASTLYAIPGVVHTLPDGTREARISVTVNGDTVSIQVDDALGQDVLDAITAAVAAHDATPDLPPPPPPDKPDFGTDIPADFDYQLAQTVTNLRQYLTVPTPTAAQSAAALKTTIRVLLYLVRKQTG